MNDTPDYTSRVPHYTFADTLEAQEEQLKTNPLMLRLIESRKGYAGDPHRPHLPLHKSRSDAQRSQWTLFLAGQMASVLSGISAGGYPPALGSCDQR